MKKPNNVFKLVPPFGRSVEETLDETKKWGFKKCLVAGWDENDEFMSAGSGLMNKDAVYLAEQIIKYTLEGE